MNDVRSTAPAAANSFLTGAPRGTRLFATEAQKPSIKDDTAGPGYDKRRQRNCYVMGQQGELGHTLLYQSKFNLHLFRPQSEYASTRL